MSVVYQIHEKEDPGTYILWIRADAFKRSMEIRLQMPSLIWDGMCGNQKFGSALAFLRRYALL